MLTIAAVSVVWFETQPGNPAISVQVDPRRGILQNITVSCYQCVPYNKDVWEGTLSIQGEHTADVSDPSGASVAMTLKYGVAFPLSSGTSCTGYFTNSSCVLPLSGPLPFTVGFDIQKTSTGGILKMTVYYGNDNSLVFQTASGEIARTITFESI